MANTKTNSVSIITFTIIVFFLVLWIFFKGYGIIINTTAESIIDSTKATYYASVRSEENKKNINEFLQGYPKSIIDLYYRNMEPFSLRFESFEKFKKNNSIETNGFPKDFNEFDRNSFTLSDQDINLSNVISVSNENLTIKGNLYEVTNKNYKSNGTWAVYFNDSLKFSSKLILTEEKDESLGNHSFLFKFNENKEIYLRIVYSFENLEKQKTEYYVIEKIIKTESK